VISQEEKLEAEVKKKMRASFAGSEVCGGEENFSQLVSR